MFRKETPHSSDTLQYETKARTMKVCGGGAALTRTAEMSVSLTSGPKDGLCAWSLDLFVTLPSVDTFLFPT